MLADIGDFLFTSKHGRKVRDLNHQIEIANLTFQLDKTKANNAHALAVLKINHENEIKVIQIEGEARVKNAQNELLKANLDEKYILHAHELRMKALTG